MLSRLCESEPVSETSGSASLNCGSSGEVMIGPRARAQLRLPSTVLISPLWAR